MRRGSLHPATLAQRRASAERHCSSLCAMAPKLARGMDPLACLASDEEEEEKEEEEDDGDRNGHAHAPLAGAKAPVVDYEALQRAGYRGCVCSQLSPALSASLAH